MVRNPERLASIDLNLLVAFDALMAERSVTSAAARLGVQQPALSSSLARLRRLFEDPLFVREVSLLVPTPLAESLARPVATALAAAQELIDARRSFDATRDVHTFTILASDYVSVTLLHPLFARLPELAPNVAIVLRPVTPDFVERLGRRQVDLAIMPAEIAGSHDGMCERALFTDRNVCVIDATRTDIGGTLTASQFDSLPLLTYEGGSLGALGAGTLGRHGLDRDLDASAESFLIAAFMVAGTQMGALLPHRLAEHLATATGTRVVETPSPLPTFVETMYWSERASGDPALQWMRDTLHTLATETVGDAR